MAYTHLTMKELGWIETYYEIGYKATEIAKKLGRSNQPIYNVVNFLKEGGTVRDYYARYKENKSKCGALVPRISPSIASLNVRLSSRMKKRNSK